jgi:Xaa-Pro aminopeptidase
VDHGLRRSHLAARLTELEVEGLVVTRLPNVRFLTGFTGSNAQVVVAVDGSAVFLTDGRYGAQSSHEVPDLPGTVYRQGYPQPLVNACRTLGIGRAGFERHALTYEGWEQLTERAEGLELVPVGPEVEHLRRTKDPEEIALIDRAQGCADRAFETVVLGGGLREGVTERAFAMVLETAMVEAGAEDRAFDSIVAFGDHAAEPHHHLTDRGLARGDMVKLDFGARVDGYHSDITRTVAFGEPDRRLHEIRDVVAAAQRAGIEAVRPGVSTVEVDAAARSVIVDAGHGDAFPHGLGHGVGLEIHEAPSLRWDGGEELVEGMVVTIEPGVYIPGLGGVRIEDMVEVTADGRREIPRATKELMVL